MSGSEKAGNGRGSNRKRPFRRRHKENNAWQEEGFSEKSGNSFGNAGQRNRGQVTENHGRQNRNPPSHKTEGKPRDEGHLRGSAFKKSGENTRIEKTPIIERQKWIPPVLNNDPLPVHDCQWCGKPIRDITLAIADKNSGAPVHFECVAAKIAGAETLERGDVVTYIGGGRFGVVNFDSSGESTEESSSGSHSFKIKKIIEWENTDKRAEWRSEISDHYSIVI